MDTDTEAAINDLAVACLDAAEVHDTAANGCADADLEKRLRDLSESRRNAAASLGEVLARVADGPLWPEPEKVLFSKAATWLRSTLSADADESLISACRDAEVAIRDAAAAGLDHDLAAPLREGIVQIRDDAEAKISQFDNALGDPRGDRG